MCLIALFLKNASKKDVENNKYPGKSLFQHLQHQKSVDMCLMVAHYNLSQILQQNMTESKLSHSFNLLFILAKLEVRMYHMSDFSCTSEQTFLAKNIDPFDAKK